MSIVHIRHNARSPASPLPPPKLTASFLTPRLPFSDPVLVFLYFFLFFMASTAFCFFVAGEMATRRAEKAWQTPALLCM